MFGLKKLIAGVHGKGRTVPYLQTPRTASDLQFAFKFAVTASSGISILSNGAVAAGSTVNPAVSSEEWASALMTPADWQVRFIRNSGTAWNQGGLTSGTWYNCTTDRLIGYYYITTAVNVSSVNTIEFRKVGTTTPVYSFPNITISCVVTS